MKTPSSSRACAVAAGVLAALSAFGCDREKRAFDVAPASTTSSPFDGNAWATSEGNRLFMQFNCSGCHANGGGGMGPPLMDAGWRYGSDPASVYQTIMKGRPNGMPAFESHVTEEQAWKLVEYVRSLPGLTPRLQRPSRADSLQSKTPEYQREPQGVHPEAP